MASAQKKAVQRHRRRREAEGLVRVELRARKTDAPLLKLVAKGLSGQEAAAFRARLQTALVAPSEGTREQRLRDLLTNGPGDDEFERVLLDRDKSMPRPDPF